MKGKCEASPGQVIGGDGITEQDLERVGLLQTEI
jgi:hypothetical protein